MTMSQSSDGKYWTPAVPAPLWIGWLMRIARCHECGSEFRGKGWRGLGANEDYQTHYAAKHFTA